MLNRVGMSTTLDEGLVATRATLLARLKDWQDQSSWQDFFDTYSRLIFTVALKSGLTRDEAQDIVQDTTLSVAKHMPTFVYDPSIGSFKSWLLNVTRWRIRDHLRKKNKWPNLVVEETEGEEETRPLERAPDPASLDLDALWEAEWQTNLMAAATDKAKRLVAPETFQVFDFYVNKDWPPEKVAKTFGVEVSQVYAIKHHINTLIKEEAQRLARATC